MRRPMSNPAGESVLGRILDTTREDVERRRTAVGLAELEARLGRSGDHEGHAGAAVQSSQAPSAPFADALARPGIGVIAEHKRRSPSAGVLREGASVADLVGAYERGGARAISVLTEERHFDGSLEDLHEAREASSLPIRRKDFIIDPYQLYEAAAAGADAVLLIVAALDPDRLAELSASARALGLETLVEVHDESELESALTVPGVVIGINNRDLTDFSVDVRRTFELLDRIPAGRLVVSESGVHERRQLDELEAAGVHAVLVGERLMRARDPEAACRALTEIRGR
jgi:indole-3-glycerol phosphate synthase